MDRQSVEATARVLNGRFTRRTVLGRLAVGGAAGVLAGRFAQAEAAPRSTAVGRRVAAQQGAATVAANPLNVLSAAVTVDGSGAQRVRVEYMATGAAGGVAEATPDFAVAGARTTVPVLGLHPDTDYQLQAVATGADGSVGPVGPPMTFRTGTLPALVPEYSVTVNGEHEPGYTLVSATSMPPNQFLRPSLVVIVDETGRVVWYRETQTGPLDFQLQPNGHFTVALSQEGSIPILGASVYEEWDLLGNTVATWSAQGYDFTDWHDLKFLNGGEEGLIFALVGQKHDTTKFGGPPDALVVGHVLQRVSRTGQVLFEWNAFDHFKLEDAIPFAWNDPNVPEGFFDWTHPNAVWVDTDGHYLQSTRHLSEITKINSQTGEMIWRMGGGPANQFTFVDDPHNGFSQQHAVQRLENGNILILDNGNDHKPPSSRSVEYEVDEANKTARLVWSFEPGAFAFAMGYNQRLPGGNTLVNLGHDHRVFEVTPAGDIVWDLKLPFQGWGATAWRERPIGMDGGIFGVYRAMRIPSLYGTPR